jgi:hypothetical protein
MRTAAYVYTGWHPIAERDASFHPGFTEWELVAGCRPRFPGHQQPKVPLLGPYDDRDPIEIGRRLQLALAHGIDAFVFGVFWCRGKRVFEQGLDDGFLRSAVGGTAPFVCEWLIAQTGSNSSIAFYVMACNVASLLALYHYKDRYREALR